MVDRWTDRFVGCVVAALLVPVAVAGGGYVVAAAGLGEEPAPAEVATAAIVGAAVLGPAYCRHADRALDRARHGVVGVAAAVGFLGLAGYAGLAPVPDPVALLAAATLLAVALPIAHGVLRRRFARRGVVVAGDDPEKLQTVASSLGGRTSGYLSPTSTPALEAAPGAPAESSGDSAGGDSGGPRPDGGREVVARDEHRLVVRSGEGSDAGVHDGQCANPSDGPVQADAPLPEDLRTDGGSPGADQRPERIAGLSQLDRVAASPSVDEVALAFSESDRQEFFGALRVCHDRGVDALVHASHAGAVLCSPPSEEVARAPSTDAGGPSTDAGLAAASDGGAPAACDPDSIQVGDPDSVHAGDGGSSTVDGGGPAAASDRESPRTDDVVDVDVEPLAWHSRLAKRAFDVAFASVALVALAPLFALVAIAVKLDSPGPVLHSQTRTAELGDTFQLYKFRSMVADAEAREGPRLSEEDAGEVDPRVTRVGRVLRATHLDELPQLVSVLRGDMSVVGPRPERPAIDAEIGERGIDWTRRWFVPPGLTGLAQIEGCTGFEPARKLAHDLAYARRQSLLLDVRIVLEQVRLVLADVVGLLRTRVSGR